jgi:hypothetical protein
VTRRDSVQNRSAASEAHLPNLSTAGALLAEIIMAGPVDIPAASTGSTGSARIIPTGATVLDIQKTGSNIGTMTFAAAGSRLVFAHLGRTPGRPAAASGLAHR